MLLAHQIPRSKYCLSLFFLALLILRSGVRADLANELKPVIEAHAGSVAVAIKNLETGETYLHNETEVMPTASLIKFPVLIELYRQAELKNVQLDSMVTLHESDKVPGSGILTDHFQSGMQLSLETAARLMIRYSDNTATNLVVDQIGLASTASTMRDMGMPETQLHAKVFRRESSIAPERSQAYGLGSTTARDMLKLLEQLNAKTLVSANASEKMLQHLAACDDDTKLRRMLPKSVKSYNKTGAVSDVRTDAGLFKTPKGMLAMVVLTSKNKDTRWTDDNAAELLCGRIGKIAHDWFNPPGTGEAVVPTVLQVGSTGELVESLQRALNAKISPSPNLTVDGDFGSMTEAATKKFQLGQNLEPTGKVDAATWAKLGSIQLGPEAKEDSLPLPGKEPRDEIEGRPFVSAKAWVIVDGDSGEIIDGDEQDEKLDFASTTKMMTAWLIAKEAAKDPKILEESLLYSRRADDTIGSTSTVRAGESLKVKDALFGLMLPSGNDASVAFAEHFGERLRPDGCNETDPLAMFIAAMNAEVLRLGMNQSHFVNPHGLTHAEHRSSCVDLAKLANTVLSSPLLREIVGTREYKCTVHGVSGYKRDVAWRNTNQLLGIDGFIGVKTGTTDAAGACLVSCSERDSKKLIVVVLGSTGSAARYSDSRNLHRWGWQKTELPKK
ncbi:MAG: serine hydrolase [Pirellula sp.]|jgi:D-alanyl-D-alanine carboxypeptidase (penicillin-binding protein 5/6)